MAGGGHRHRGGHHQLTKDVPTFPSSRRYRARTRTQRRFHQVHVHGMVDLTANYNAMKKRSKRVPRVRAVMSTESSTMNCNSVYMW